MASRLPVERFVGGTGLLTTGVASRERTINRVIQSTQNFGGKVQKFLRGRPGLNPFAQVSDTDTSALFYQDSFTYACTGTTFSQVFFDGTTIVRGTITYDARYMATIVGGGTPASGDGSKQIMIVSSAGDVYVYNQETFAFTQVPLIDPVTGLPFGFVMCEFMDGYFLGLRGNSRRVYYSALENALLWDLTFGYFERSWASDNILGFKRSGRQLWLLGSKTGEVWADTGNQNDPFAPIQGALLDIGTIAPFTIQRDGETLTWLNYSEHGDGLVVRASGYQPSQIQTYPIAQMIQQQITAGQLSFSEACVCQMEGHVFYELHIPEIDTTPVFDIPESEWVEWAQWDIANAIWLPRIVRCHAAAFEKHLVGVRDSGVIYQQSFDYFDDGISA